MKDRPGNGQDKQAARAELTRRLMQLAPKARLEALLEQADAKALVRSLRSDELYAAIYDVGLTDAVEIVQLASPEQFQAFLDLGGWSRDHLEPQQVLAWFRAARGEDHDEWMAKLRGIDLEVLEHVLRQCAVIHDLEENPDVNPPGVTLETPEGKYLVELTVEGADQAVLRAVLHDLMGENAFEATRLLEAVRWELPSEMEETAFRFRTARLADLGFPELDEAVKLFAYVDPDRERGGTAAAAEGLAPDLGRVDFVEMAFRGLEELERQNLEDEVRHVVNAALVAQGAEPGDTAAIRRISEQARALLNLGLEHLTGGLPQRAADVVRDRPLRRIFQIGFSLTLRLRFAAQRLEREEGGRPDKVWLALNEEARALDAVSHLRPMRPPKVEGAEPVPFRTRREVADTQALIERGSRQVQVLRALLGTDASQTVLTQFGRSLSELGAERVFSAGVVHALLDGRLTLAPVPAGRLVELCERLFDRERTDAPLRPAALNRATEVLAGAVPPTAVGELRTMVERIAAQLGEELGVRYTAEGTVDPRAVTLVPLAP